MNFQISTDNRMFMLAREAKRLPGVWGAIPLSLAFLVGAALIGGIPGIILASLASKLPWPTVVVDALEQTILLIFSFAPIFLLLWIWLWLYEKRPFRTLGLEPTHLLGKYALGFLCGALLFGLALGAMAALGFVSSQTSGNRSLELPALGSILIMAAGWIVQGPGEEILCRGWLMPVLSVRYRPWIGIAVSSVVFAFYHSLNPNLNPVAILNLALFGVFISLYALMEGGVWGVFALHTAWNWSQGNLFGLPVSGTEAGGASLFHLTTTGSPLVTGGAFGPEGGLAVTVVLLGGIAFAGWFLRKRQTVIPEKTNSPV